ncbi:Lipopolysaccharide-assembly [Saccharicrinis carchari]|uniref:Lipopolysaccharide-assembly n=1 Tax=Saccharicrinis carchari TaxID=1168039 RepID=A0A521C556_SACCC|nr:LptE family protein [Saccharicrinis carchari]SMO53961.1 Lipopolysaccharide-assembly [Saccharicrinis carchari]
MKQILLGLILIAGLTACSVRFTLKGSSVPDNLNTFTVQYFENRAPLINPTLSQSFTEALKDRVTRESRLVLEAENGDVDFSGEITGYSIRPMAIQADALSAETRLTVSVKVRYRNFKNPKDNWESQFSAYEDYPSEQNINDIEAELTTLIIEQLTEDIFNKAFSDW